MRTTLTFGGLRPRLVVSSTIALLTTLLAGCGSYATSGRAANFQALGVSRNALTDGSIVQSLAKQPLAQFPTGIAVARIQAPGYRSETANTWGHGAYCVVTNRAAPRLRGKCRVVSGVPGEGTSGREAAWRRHALAPHRLEQVADLLLYLFRRRDRLTDVLAEQVAVALSEAVDGNLHRPLGHARRGGNLGV
jgi:hypothetical protein